jgi:molybdate transport repressor ModE-like protein
MSKPLDRLTLLETFVRIAESGSISAAARDLGLSQPSASRQLAELETRLQAQLMRRSTHSLALTEAGQALLIDARRMLDEWQALAERHGRARDQIEGRLKIVAPVALGQKHLARIATQFLLDHPKLTLNWELEDHSIRFAERGCDCWLKIGSVPDESLIVREVGRVERLLVAAPSLFHKKRTFNQPDQLEAVPLLALVPFEGGQIPLHDRSGRSEILKPEVRLKTNNIFSLKEAALQGLGMAVLPQWFITDELADGSLLDLLPTWRAAMLPIHLAHLPGRHQPRRLEAFFALMTEQIREIPGVLPPLEK